MRYIDCEVNDEYVIGSGVVIGASGSHNDVGLRLKFGDMWAGLNIYATFTDANGEGSAVVMLMPSMLDEGEAMTYLLPIPAEAKRYAGKSMLTLSGYSKVNGTQVDKATNTVTAFFRVLKSNYRLLTDSSVTPTLAQQLHSEVNSLGERIEETETDVADIREDMADIEDKIDKIQAPDSNIPEWALQPNKPSYSKEEVGLGNVENVRQYSASNPPPYPVTSVNQKTGDVTVTVPSKTSDLENDSGFIKSNEAPVQSVNGKSGAVTLVAEDVGARPSTWTPTYSDVGADKSGAASSAVSSHNTNTDAHNDIRLLIAGLTERLNALANSTDDDLDQMAEIVAYIKANKTLIDSITTSKVSVADVVNNLTSNVANKPLSAAQGVALKALIDAIEIPTNLSQLTDDSSHRTVTDAEKTMWNAKIGQSDLQDATDAALAQAKASGEFDGEDGKDYVLTEADKAEIAGMVGEVALPDYWESYLPDKVAAIKAHQDEGGKDCFSFVVMTDIHYPSNLGKRSPAIAKRLLDECNIRCVMCLGDVQNRGSHSSKANVVAEWESIKEMFKPIRENLLAEQGNHDGSWGATLNGVTYPYNLKPEEIFNLVFANTYKYHNAITDESGTAYYVDDTTRKVRYILLNCTCNPYEENEDGSAKYNNMKYFRFTQSQYDFLTNKALVIDEDGWAVVVLAHVPIENNYAEAWGGNTTIGDHIIMRNLLKAYKEKKTYKAEWAGTAGGGAPTGGYTNLFSTSGSGFTKQSDTKYLTNWIPYNVADNGGKGTIYHLKGFVNNSGYTNPYKMHFATDSNGTSASELMYCTNASVLKNVVASYDSDVKLVQHTADKVYKYVQFEFREALPENLIITANEDIIEATGGGELGYDAVSVNADFTNAKGEFVAYFSGHMHNDYLYPASSYGIDIITTRCDGAEENNATLKAERVAGTVTEQSFDVFTVNKAKRKIYATKIGAGADREISY